MIIWNWGRKVDDLQSVGPQQCGACRQERLHTLSVAYRYFALYWIFSVVTSTEYYVICTRCRNGWKIDRARAEGQVGGNPIPIWRRFGLAGLGVMIGLAVLLSLVGEAIK